MSVRNLITGVVAGVIVFAWGMLSWMALPFHANTINKLNAEPVAVEGIKLAAPKSGMYSYPAMDAPKEDMSKVPHILVAMNYTEKKMPICMSIAILIQILAGLVLTCLVAKSNREKFGERMMLILKAVFFATFVAVLPNWLYWGFTPMYTLLAFIDLLIGWGLAGLWIAKRA